MKKQRFERRSEAIRERFNQSVKSGELSLSTTPRLSWSIWMFGREPLPVSLERLQNLGLSFVELAGNHHTRESGTRISEIRSHLDEYGIKVSGVCGLYSPSVDLATDDPFRGQNALDYIRREIEYVHEVGGEYLIVVPSAVGRPGPLGEEELARSAERLALLAPEFQSAGVKAAVEPIRADEVSLVHTVDEAMSYIDAVAHPAVQHINGDIYHMLFGELHIGEAILRAGKRLANLHLADSNRGALGTGMIDLDTVLRSYALAVEGNLDSSFLTGEPIGAGRDPYSALTTVPDREFADALVGDTVASVLERWEIIQKEAESFPAR